ncbi:MAG: type II toxin-antitoxin system RelE/ParE family toxin [Verrucomicrobiota bacterium]
MGYQVILTRLAQDDLQEITEYIALDDPVSAERFANQLLDEALELENFPQRGRPLKRKPDVLRVVNGNYVIFYRIEAEAAIVRVLRFWNGARHPNTPPFVD